MPLARGIGVRFGRNLTYWADALNMLVMMLGAGVALFTPETTIGFILMFVLVMVYTVRTVEGMRRRNRNARP